MSAIYLAFNSPEEHERRTGVFNTLVKAGLQVFPSDIYFEPGKSQIAEQLNAAGLSLHVFGTKYGTQSVEGRSLEELQYVKALDRLAGDPGFRVIIWFPFQVSDVSDDRQREFISRVRNGITHGVVFSNTPSAIQLADDIRVQLAPVTRTEYDVKHTDIFLAYNQLDDHEASEIIDMLSDIVPVEKVNIIQDSDTDYSELCAQQIGRSKLAVVYFKESAEWALPFTQQIWKRIGGASSHTPILLIGDDDPESNLNKKFKAPKVVSLIVSGELIPLEIKVQYDKAIEVNS
jgi:hypothetical protein